MATLKKKKNRLGAPPPRTETPDNLIEPETAAATSKTDKRSLRKTGMTEQFNTRLTKECLKKLRAVAKEDGRTIGKTIERALDIYIKHRKGNG